MKQHKGDSRVLLWMSRTAGKAKLYIFVLLLAEIALGLTGVYYALLLRNVVNAAVAGDRSGFFAAVAWFAALVVLQIAVRAAERHFSELCSSELENRFKRRLFSSLMNGSYSSVTAVHSGEWMNRLTTDTSVAADGMTNILPRAVGMAVKMVGALMAIIWLVPQLLYILVPGGVFILVFTSIFRKITKRLHTEIRESDGRLRVFMSERLSGLMVIRSFSQEKHSEETAQQLMDEHRDARMRRNAFSNILNTGFSAAMNGVYVLGALYCGYGILNGTMSFGNLTAVLQLISQIRSPIANITGYMPKYTAMTASAERLMEADALCGNEPEPRSSEEIKRLYSEKFTALGLRNASFSYQPTEAESAAPIVLSDLSIEIKKGEYAAFTGPSGCGKSTVLKLLMNLYPLEEGETYIRLGSREEKLDSTWRSLFAYVPQGNQLLSGTIREIISFGDSEKMRDEDKLRCALHAACADEFVDELENGLDTLLGERGMGLSEGQMQRIAIARAVFSDRPILLLDEATSALDAGTEAKLLENLHRMTDMTVITVTHRSAVLDICDRHFEFGGEND